MTEKLLTKPALVHHTVFAAGLPERMVIECAQRHFEWLQDAKREAAKPLLSPDDFDRIRRGEPLKELRLPLQGRSKQQVAPPYVHPARKPKDPQP